MPKLLTRSQIVEQQTTLKTQEEPIPEWGGSVLVRELTAIEVSQLGISVFTGSGPVSSSDLQDLQDLDTVPLDLDDLVDRFPFIVSCAVVDQDLNQILTEEDVSSMSGRSAEPIMRIVSTCLTLSDLMDTDTPGETAKND